MDKWIKKLAAPFPKLRAALSHRPAADVERSAKPPVCGSGPKAEGKRETACAPQRSGNLGTGTPSADVAAPLSPSPNPIAPETSGKPSASHKEGQGETGPAFNKEQFRQRDAETCPYCGSKDFIKRGTRKNKLQVVQLYECKNQECGRTFP